MIRIADQCSGMSTGFIPGDAAVAPMPRVGRSAVIPVHPHMKSVRYGIDRVGLLKFGSLIRRLAAEELSLIDKPIGFAREKAWRGITYVPVLGNNKGPFDKVVRLNDDVRNNRNGRPSIGIGRLSIDDWSSPRGRRFASSAAKRKVSCPGRAIDNRGSPKSDQGC